MDEKGSAARRKSSFPEIAPINLPDKLFHRGRSPRRPCPPGQAGRKEGNGGERKEGTEEGRRRRARRWAAVGGHIAQPTDRRWPQAQKRTRGLDAHTGLTAACSARVRPDGRIYHCGILDTRSRSPFEGKSHSAIRSLFTIFCGTSGIVYRDRLKCLYVVARSLILLLLNCSAWPCLGLA